MKVSHATTICAHLRHVGSPARQGTWPSGCAVQQQAPGQHAHGLALRLKEQLLQFTIAVIDLDVMMIRM